MEEIGADVAKLARRSSAAVFLLFPASEATFSDIRLLEHAFLKTLDADPAAVFTTREFTTVSREKDREVAEIAAKHIAAARGKAFVFCGADSMVGYFYDLMKEHGLTAPQDYILMGFLGVLSFRRFIRRTRNCGTGSGGNREECGGSGARRQYGKLHCRTLCSKIQ